ncbi:MAG: hypothetical protein PHV13_02770 [Candidatus ainarchaeum sp.]|nr:hypothetical protein [Candidatus ainarchaeum sp.]
MAIRREILLIVVLLVIIALLVKLAEFVGTINVEGADASKFVLEDLRTKYPTADIAIMSMTPKYNDQGGKYFEVKARVTRNADTPCPERSHIFYNYPQQNFVPQQPEVITTNCAVCAEGICTIAFAEEAIIASHSLPGTSAIQAYLRVNQNAVPAVTEKPDAWLVKWDSATAAMSYSVEIHRNGSVMNVTESSKG